MHMPRPQDDDFASIGNYSLILAGKHTRREPGGRVKITNEAIPSNDFHIIRFRYQGNA